MAEIVAEDIYTATIADIPDSARETLMVVQPPVDIQPGLWARCLAHVIGGAKVRRSVLESMNMRLEIIKIC